jgi:hypothetical protein
MLVSPCLSTEHVQVAQIKKNTMTVDILILGESLGQKRSVETTTLLDTGADPIEVFNVDETLNKQGTIMKYTWLDLTINGQT